MATILQAFGKKIAVLRNKKGLTQEQLAWKVEITVNYISKLERGLANPSYTILLKIKQGLGCSWEDIL